MTIFVLLLFLQCFSSFVKGSEQPDAQNNDVQAALNMQTALEVLDSFKPILDEFPQIVHMKRAGYLTLSGLRYLLTPDAANRARLVADNNNLEDPLMFLLYPLFASINATLRNVTASVTKYYFFRPNQILEAAAERTLTGTHSSGLLVLLEDELRKHNLPRLFVAQILKEDHINGEEKKSSTILELEWPHEICFQASRSVSIKYIQGELCPGYFLYVREDYLWWHHERLPGLRSPWQRSLYESHPRPQTTPLVNPDENSKLISMEALWETLLITSDPVIHTIMDSAQIPNPADCHDPESTLNFIQIFKSAIDQQVLMEEYLTENTHIVQLMRYPVNWGMTFESVWAKVSALLGQGVAGRLFPSFMDSDVYLSPIKVSLRDPQNNNKVLEALRKSSNRIIGPLQVFLGSPQQVFPASIQEQLPFFNKHIPVHSLLYRTWIVDCGRSKLAFYIHAPWLNEFIENHEIESEDIVLGEEKALPVMPPVHPVQGEVKMDSSPPATSATPINIVKDEGSNTDKVPKEPTESISTSDAESRATDLETDADEQTSKTTRTWSILLVLALIFIGIGIAVLVRYYMILNENEEKLTLTPSYNA